MTKTSHQTHTEARKGSAPDRSAEVDAVVAETGMDRASVEALVAIAFGDSPGCCILLDDDDQGDDDPTTL